MLQRSRTSAFWGPAGAVGALRRCVLVTLNGLGKIGAAVRLAEDRSLHLHHNDVRGRISDILPDVSLRIRPEHISSLELPHDPFAVR